MKKTFIALMLIPFTLAACGHETGSPTTDTMKDSDKPVEVASSFVGDYQTFSDDVIGNGEHSVLFFYAAWCSTCKAKDASLSEWYASAEFPVKTYRVDYDTAKELNAQYGVTMQDTFVLINGEGTEVTKAVAPSLSDLKRLLYVNIQEAQAEAVEEGEEPAAKVASDGSYTAYTAGVVGNGEESVLFFHAPWCPKCKTNDGLLSSFYGSADYPRSVYKIDYDTAADLKAQFGVTGQDTFILIDGNGSEIERVRFPSESALRDLLG